MDIRGLVARETVGEKLGNCYKTNASRSVFENEGTFTTSSDFFKHFIILKLGILDVFGELNFVQTWLQDQAKVKSSPSTSK